MKKLISAIIVAFTLNAYAGEELELGTEFQFQPVVEVGYASKDVFRGAQLADDERWLKLGVATALPYDLALALSLTASNDDVGDETVVSVELTRSLTDLIESADLTTLVPFLTDVEASLGFNGYSEGNNSITGRVTNELAFGLSTTIYDATLSYTQFFAIDGENDGYGEFGVSASPASYGLELPLDVTVSATLGLALETGDATHAQFTISGDYEVPFGGFVVTPYISLVKPFEDEVGMYAGADTETVFGIKASF